LVQGEIAGVVSVAVCEHVKIRDRIDPEELLVGYGLAPRRRPPFANLAIRSSC